MTEEDLSKYLNVDPSTGQITGSAPNKTKFELFGRLSDAFEKINGKVPGATELQNWLKTENPEQKP